jgi:peroxiredoxin
MYNQHNIIQEIAVKKTELDACRKELALLQTRLKVGEINLDTYQAKSKGLAEKIEVLEKKVLELQNLVNARPAGDTPIQESARQIEDKEPLMGKREASLKDRVKKNRVLSIVIAVAIIGLLIWGALALFLPGIGSSVGKTAPDFVMQLGDDKTSALSSFRGKNVILVFWDRDFWDGQFFQVNGVVRKLYLPDKLNEIYSKYSRDELEVIAVASGTSNDEVDKLISDYGVSFPAIVDSYGKLRTEYNISYEPTYIFVDKSGIIRARVEGPIINLSDLEQILYNIGKNGEIKQVRPPITDVLIQSVSEKSAVVNWVTEKPTTTQVDIDGKNIQTIITPAPQTLHSLTLRDLWPNTPYHVRIVYNINNTNISEHSFSALSDTIVSRRYVFTASINDMSYPEISSISVGFITDSSITVTWKTDEPTTGEVDYGVTKEYTGTASQGDKMSIWHTVRVDGLKSGTLYYLKLRSKDVGGRETVQEIEPVKTQGPIETAPVVGKRAPDFTLETIDGNRYSLDQFHGRKVLLNFWLIGCAACEVEMPLLQNIYSKYNRDQLIILAVNVRGEPDKVKLYVGTEKLTFPVLIDSEGTVDNLYKPPFFPTTFFIDSNGIIREIRTERFQTVSEIDDILEDMN